MHSTDFAVLTDQTGSAAIHQTTSGGQSQFSLDLDFIGATSPQGQLLDTLFFSIYLGDNAFVSPTSPGSFDEVITMFDVDANGVSNIDPGVTIVPHPTRAGWSRASINFATTRGNVTPHIQLFEQNGVASDSSVGVDRFELIAVPEPATPLLCLIAGSLYLTSRRKKAY